MISGLLALWLSAMPAPDAGPTCAAGAPPPGWFPKGPPPAHLKPTDEEYWEYVLPQGGIDAGPQFVLPQFRWDLQGVESVVDVPELVMVDDIPVKLRHVVVRGRIEDVMQGIINSFIKQELWVQDPEEQIKLSHHTQLTAFDYTRYVSYTVMARPIDAKRVSLILGEANIGARAEAKRHAKQPFAPVYPGAGAPLASVTEGLKTLTYEVKATAADVKAFYEETLTRSGYQKSGDDRWRRLTDEIHLQVRAAAGAKSVVVLTQRAAMPDDFTTGP